MHLLSALPRILRGLPEGRTTSQNKPFNNLILMPPHHAKSYVSQVTHERFPSTLSPPGHRASVQIPTWKTRPTTHDRRWKSIKQCWRGKRQPCWRGRRCAARWLLLQRRLQLAALTDNSVNNSMRERVFSKLATRCPKPFLGTHPWKSYEVCTPSNVAGPSVVHRDHWKILYFGMHQPTSSLQDPKALRWLSSYTIWVKSHGYLILPSSNGWVSMLFPWSNSKSWLTRKGEHKFELSWTSTSDWLIEITFVACNPLNGSPVFWSLLKCWWFVLCRNRLCHLSESKKLIRPQLQAVLLNTQS